MMGRHRTCLFRFKINCLGRKLAKADIFIKAARGVMLSLDLVIGFLFRCRDLFFSMAFTGVEWCTTELLITLSYENRSIYEHSRSCGLQKISRPS